MDTKLLDKYVADNDSIWKDHTQDIPKYQIGSTIGTHIGPNAIGVAYFSKE